MVSRTHSRFRQLRPIFANGDPEMMRHLVRLVVAFEDFHIEAQGMLAERLGDMDLVSATYRQLYFFRRAIVSILEIEQAINALNRNVSFRVLKAKFRPKNSKEWSAAVSFFAVNHAALKKRRGLYGGHFTDQAADAVVSTLSSADSAVGTLEIRYTAGHTAERRVFKFAQEFVSIGMAADRGEESVHTFIPGNFALVTEAMNHATNAVAVIGEEYLFPHFGSTRQP